MGWASDSLFRSLGINPSSQYVAVASAGNTKEETVMNNFSGVTPTTEFVKVSDDRHILGHTDKAIQVRIGQTLYGEPITTFYPKQFCQIRYKAGGGYDVYVPKWCNRKRLCRVGDFNIAPAPGFDPLPF